MGKTLGILEIVSITTQDQKKQVYWFHPDHLGSSSFITGADGEVTQNIEYVPSGETFVENHRNSNYSPYKFNGKELDAETGYYYYGARYYNPRVSLWLNVDPLAEKYPSWSPYVYCKNAPVTHVDPDGREALKWPPKGYWQAMYNDDLQHLYSNPEKGFERMFARYYKENSLQPYNSSPQLTTRFGDVFKPDGVSKYPHGYVLFDGSGVSVKYKDNISFFEVTTAKKNAGSITLADKKGQLKAYIDYLYQTPENRSVPGYRTFFDKQGRFNLVTLPEIKILVK